MSTWQKVRFLLIGGALRAISYTFFAASGVFLKDDAYLVAVIGFLVGHVLICAAQITDEIMRENEKKAQLISKKATAKRQDDPLWGMIIRDAKAGDRRAISLLQTVPKQILKRNGLA